MNLEFIEARDLPDAWFLCIDRILEVGKKYTVDRGSYAGQERLEFDYITVHIKYPGVRPLLPDIPPSLGIPNPVADGYLEEYLPYLMTSVKQPGEDYTYGARLCDVVYEVPLYGGTAGRWEHGNQIEYWINILKDNPKTNQAVLQIAQPPDFNLNDPPCLRHIDLRISNGKLHFVVYFRSWDLFNGLPANLGALQLLKEYMSAEIGVEDGEIIASSKGLHLYDYVWELAKLRCGK